MTIDHSVKSFDQLTNKELYALLRLRSEVFVVEQTCVFLDLDDKDQHCEHLLLTDGDGLLAYARIVPAAVTFAEVSIGRVVTAPSIRGTGMGRLVMELAIAACSNLFGEVPIRIGAQCYATKFYESLGFLKDGAVYDEDGIDHVEMIRRP